MRVISIMICFIISNNIFSHHNLLSEIDYKMNLFIEKDSFSNQRLIQKILIECSQEALIIASKKDEFKNNLAIRILFPEELNHVEKKLKKIGLRYQIIDFEDKMNIVAESVSQNAFPLFEDAIKDINIYDDFSIVNQKETSLTNYLKAFSYEELYNNIILDVRMKMHQSNTTKYWNVLKDRYNALPFVKPIDLDLEDYITSKTIYALFYLIADKEKKIIENIDQDSLLLIKDQLKETFFK